MKTSVFLKSLMEDYNMFFNNIIKEIKLNKVQKNVIEEKYHPTSLHLKKNEFMPKLNKLTVITAGILLSLGSCKKDLINKENPVVLVPANFKEIKTDPNFSWNTHKKINFTFNGVPTIETVFGTLRVSLPDGSQLININQKLSDNYNAVISVPIHINSLEASFGSNKMTINIIGNSAVFNFTDTFPAEPENE